jgi:hypothetical protein
MKNLIRFLSVMMVWLFVASTPAVFAVNAVNKEYSCGGGMCSCTGDADCNDMFTKAGCGDLSYCTTNPAGRVFCQCLQRQGTASAAGKAGRFAYIVVAVDQQAGKATVQETKNGPRASIPVAAALLSRLKAGDKLYVRENSAILASLKGALAASASKKTREECDKCRNDCFDSVSKQFHVVVTQGKQQGDNGWEDALRGCLSGNGCTAKDCPQ